MRNNKLVGFMGLAFLALSCDALSEDQVMAKIPLGLDAQSVADVITRAFTGRQWEVIEASTDHVRGELAHAGHRCTLDLMIEDRAIVYENYSDSCESKERVPGPSGKKIKRDVPVPERWLNFLQRDVNSMLIGKAVTMTPSARPEEDAVSRMKKLEELYSHGLISESEYSEKRRQIIESI